MKSPNLYGFNQQGRKRSSKLKETAAEELNVTKLGCSKPCRVLNERTFFSLLSSVYAIARVARGRPYRIMYKGTEYEVQRSE